MAIDTEPFEGFSAETISFLEDLAENNTKEFFHDNRERYDAHWVAPARGFVEALGLELKSRVSPDIQADPRINGSIFRINRDTRFSKDKTPYKTHLDMMFWEGEGRSRDCPGFFFRLVPEAVHLGAGKHGFDKEQLAAYREAVDDGDRGAALEAAIEQATGALDGAELGGQHYKRVPRGYPKDHPRADLLRFKGLHVFIERQHPKCLGSPEFVTWCAERLEKLAPVHTWLVEVFEG